MAAFGFGVALRKVGASILARNTNVFTHLPTVSSVRHKGKTWYPDGNSDFYQVRLRKSRITNNDNPFDFRTVNKKTNNFVILGKSVFNMFHQEAT